MKCDFDSCKLCTKDFIVDPSNAAKCVKKPEPKCTEGECLEMLGEWSMTVEKTTGVFITVTVNIAADYKC